MSRKLMKNVQNKSPANQIQSITVFKGYISWSVWFHFRYTRVSQYMQIRKYNETHKKIQSQEILHDHRNILIKILGQNFTLLMVENSEKTINGKITHQGDEGDMRQVYS